MFQVQQVTSSFKSDVCPNALPSNAASFVISPFLGLGFINLYLSLAVPGCLRSAPDIVTRLLYWDLMCFMYDVRFAENVTFGGCFVISKFHLRRPYLDISSGVEVFPFEILTLFKGFQIFRTKNLEAKTFIYFHSLELFFRILELRYRGIENNLKLLSNGD
jgi:hypothetical protein